MPSASAPWPPADPVLTQLPPPMQAGQILEAAGRIFVASHAAVPQQPGAAPNGHDPRLPLPPIGAAAPTLVWREAAQFSLPAGPGQGRAKPRVLQFND